MPTKKSLQWLTKQKGMPILVLLVSALLLLTLVSVAYASENQTGVVTATELYIRKEPSTDADKLRTLENGWKVDILGSEGDWYQVQYGEVIGYSAKKYIDTSGKTATGATPKSGATTSAKTVAGLGDPPSACKPGDNNKHVLKVQEALTILGYYNGRLSGNYGDLTEEAVKAYQKAKGLTADGVAGKGTIKSIFGGNSASDEKKSGNSKVKTETLDWFKDKGTDVIPKNAVMEIKDVRSGRTFKARRWSGGNHIDAEPSTKDDTAALKKCYGGAFSWRRRPILVKYNGHVYAASMNGMPHGDSTIDNNGFDGVFCIHFLNSKTHESDKVDKDHQNAVAEALKATWD